MIVLSMRIEGHNTIHLFLAIAIFGEETSCQKTILYLNLSAKNQNTLITQGFANEVDALYNRLNSCPVPSTPVYGKTPIFTCGNGGYAGCGCAAMA